MKLETQKSSPGKLPSKKIHFDFPVSAFSRADENLLVATETFHLSATTTALKAVVSSFLAANGARVISPRNEEVEFLKSAWMEQLRFSLLETMLALNPNAAITLDQILRGGYNELSTLFFWPSCSPWCIYSSIFDLVCTNCPYFIVGGSTQKASAVNSRSLCLSHDGFWFPMGHTLGETPINEDRFRKVTSIYLKTGLPLHFVNTGENYEA
jgi:hypothetical protein